MKPSASSAARCRDELWHHDIRSPDTKEAILAASQKKAEWH